MHTSELLKGTLTTRQKQELHLNAVPAGVYLLRVEVGSRIILKKLMVR
jgi:hypothetical protein